MSLQDDFLAEIKTHSRIIRKVCSIYAHTKDDQEDLFQECLYQAWKAFPHFQQEAKFSTWLYKVALNTALYHQRKNKVASLAVDWESVKHPRVAPHDHEDLAQLHQAIAELDAIEKSIILLYLEGLSYKEIGEITGFTETNVGAKLSRTKRKLKQIMTKDGF